MKVKKRHDVFTVRWIESELGRFTVLRIQVANRFAGHATIHVYIVRYVLIT